MTETGTFRLREIEYFPCSCAVCAKKEPVTVKEMPKPEREEFLARHNLHVSLTEIKRVKQAIYEGRLWEYLEMKSHAHPALLRAFKRLGKYGDCLEASGAVTKKSGFFFFCASDLARPEVVRYGRRLLERFKKPETTKVLLLLPQTRTKPFHKSREQSRVFEELDRKLSEKKRLIHVCTYAAPFGVIPSELDEVYPLSQYEAASPFDAETVKFVARQVRGYVKAYEYDAVVLLEDTANWNHTVSLECKRACNEKKIQLVVLKPSRLWSKSTLTDLVNVLREALGERA